MELSRDDAIRISKELWTWMKETGSSCKLDWPGWKKYGEMRSRCPLCHYAGQEHRNNGADSIHSICPYCPYNSKFGHCIGNKQPFKRWCWAKTGKTRKKYAKLFLAQLEQL